jgi:hypothetical protein
VKSNNLHWAEGEMKMLFIRRRESSLSLSQVIYRIKYSFLTYGKLSFIGSVLLFTLILGSFFSLFTESQTLQENKRLGLEVISHASNEEKIEEWPKAENLPQMIDQCVKIFQSKNIGVQRFNLERFGDENGGQPSYLNYAFVRLSLNGLWEGIQKGITEMESLPNQVIHVQEVHLHLGGGEILIKIYFEEPDNPSSP